ncbi:hypothetical protein ACFE04_005821 [Oxalis oulophora]
MCKNWIVFTLILLIFLCGLSSVSASTPAKIVSGVVTNVVSALFKWLWSLKSTSTTKTGLIANGFNLGALSSSRSMIKFEDGFTVETVFDGSKLGIEPYSVELSPAGELLILDSENSNIYKIAMPLSRYSRPKLLAGSSDGYSGHIDGRLREARMNHPKGLTIDDRGNIYIADPVNMAIRKISDTGVTTIAGGKWSRGGHIDGPSEDAKFSTDFDVIYIGSSCSLLVIDRGNQAIREIHLQPEDCSDQYDSSFHLGIAVLVAAAFFGYMLALLQRRVRVMFSSKDGREKDESVLNWNLGGSRGRIFAGSGLRLNRTNHEKDCSWAALYSRSCRDTRTPMRRGAPIAPYQKPQKSLRPPLIPQEDELEKIEEESFFGSIGKLVMNTCSSTAEIFGGLFSGLRKKPVPYQYQHQYPQHLNMQMNEWHRQESYVIPQEGKPPSIDSRTLAPKKSYPFMTTQDTVEKKHQHQHHSKQSRPYYSGWDGDYQQQSKKQMQHHSHQQQHHRHYSSKPKTFYEKSCETNEIVFGAVQEDGQHDAVVIKSVDYADPRYNQHNIRPRIKDSSYSQGYY